MSHPPDKLTQADEALLAFYGGRGPDHAGRHIDTIWAFDHAQLEASHDYIQWLFPNPRPSPVNPLAPVLTAAAARAFAADPELTRRLLRSLDVMLGFYGLARDGEYVERSPAFAARRAAWLRPGNHNHLRLSRILICLNETGLVALAAALRDALCDVAAHEGRGLVSARTVEIWRSIRPSRSGPPAASDRGP